jgi:glutaredoxin
VRSMTEGRASVSGVLYSGPADAPTVQMYTKAGCTLCDVAKDVLVRAADEFPHTLVAVDITDLDNAAWWAKYKYDIPVLHIDNHYWAKHRITLEESMEALQSAQEGQFETQPGEPDAAQLERPRKGPLRR